MLSQRSFISSHPFDSKSDEIYEAVVNDFISKFTVIFTEPEKNAISQNEKGASMYFILSGYCQIQQKLPESLKI